MKNYINEIAKTNKLDRFNAIINVLETNNIKYRVQSLIGRDDALGNIIVEYNPNETHKIVLCAHYDNRNNTPGANDNATACSILLNLALECKDTSKHVVFLFSDLEEEGFCGCEYYQYEEGDDISFFINLDMCGLGENILSCTYNFFILNKLEEIYTRHNVHRVNDLPGGDAYVFKYRSKTPTIYIVNSTNDDLPWYDRFSKTSNYNGMEDTDFFQTMHGPDDTPDTINLVQVEKIHDFVKDIIDVL